MLKRSREGKVWSKVVANALMTLNLNDCSGDVRDRHAVQALFPGSNEFMGAAPALGANLSYLTVGEEPSRLV